MKPGILLRIGDRVINSAHVAGVQMFPTGEVAVYLAYTDLIEPGDFVFRGVEAHAVWEHFRDNAVDLLPNIPAVPARVPPKKAEVA